MSHAVIRKVLKAGQEQGWLDSTGTIVAAVSGGGDSVALMEVLLEAYRGRVVVAHLEHGIRDASSKADADFVRDLCRDKGLEAVIRSISVPLHRIRGESLEEAARRIRYEFLEDVRDSVGASWIAVGHNSDDVVETMMLNLLRGTGAAGLCGLPGRRGLIVRPLIHCSRHDLRDFLLQRGLPWCEDETNRDTRYVRNRIRLQLIPHLSQSYNPAFAEKMLSLRENLLPFRNILEARGREAALLLRRNLPLATSAWDLHSLRRLEPSTRTEVFRSEASRLGLGTLDHHQMDRLLDLVSTRQGWRFQWEKTLEIRAGGGFIALVDRNLFDKPPDPPFRLAESGGKTRWGCGWILWEPAGIKKPALSDYSAFLPASQEMPAIMASSEALSQSRLAEIPWFYRKCWPTIVFGDKMSWTPFWGRSRELQRTGSLCYRLTYMPDQKMGVS